MSTNAIGFFGRLAMAFVLPWRLLFDGRLAARLQSAQAGAKGALPEGEADEAAQAEEAAEEGGEAGAVAAPRERAAAAPAIDRARIAESGALHMLSLLQRDGRLIDFLLEDVAGFSDAEVGAAARTVHEGCRKTLEQYLDLGAVRAEEEGSQITVPAGFDPGEVRLVGNVTGEPPYKGVLAHPGWRVTGVKLPEKTQADDEAALPLPYVLAPAEIEL